MAQIRNIFREFHLTLTFMTRLGRAKLVNTDLLGRALVYFAPVGMVVGLLSTAPVFLWHTLCPSISALQALLMAWLYVTVDLWLTRALHHDGLADIGDGLGSGAEGEHFWRIVKDSRLGAFGAISLAMTLGGTILAAAQHIAVHNFWPLILAPIYARCVCAIFACISHPKDAQSLGGLVMAGKNRNITFSHVVLALALCLYSPLLFIKGTMTLVVTGLFLYFILYKVQKHGGANGDFCGTVIVCAQLIYVFLM